MTGFEVGDRVVVMVPAGPFALPLYGDVLAVTKTTVRIRWDVAPEPVEETVRGPAKLLSAGWGLIGPTGGPKLMANPN